MSCSPRDYLTRRLAGDLISDSPEFQKQQQFVLQTGLISNKDYVSPEFLALQHRGYVTATSAKCPSAIEPPPCWDVVLTPSGVETIRNLVSPEEATKPAITVPAAKREFVSVTGIAKQGSSADVEFTWKWTPLNEIGAVLYSEEHRFRSLVGFRQFDDGWRILEGTPHTSQSIGDALKNAEPAQ